MLVNCVSLHIVFLKYQFIVLIKPKLSIIINKIFSLKNHLGLSQNLSWFKKYFFFFFFENEIFIHSFIKDKHLDTSVPQRVEENPLSNTNHQQYF